MFVDVAAHAASPSESTHRAAIVMASQALSRSVGALQANTGFSLVIKLKIVSDCIPIVTGMAERAIRGEVIVRNNRATIWAPILSTVMKVPARDNAQAE